MSRRRLVVPASAIDGDRAKITGPLSHYLSHVLRLKPGAPLLLIDGTGARYDGQVSRFSSRQVEVQITGRRPPAPAATPRLLLVYGLSRRTRTEWVLQKSTELGVDLVLTAVTERSVSRLTDRAGLKLQRWQDIVADAARQSRRSTLPLVSAPQSIDEALAQAAECAEIRLIATPEGAPLADHAQAIASPANRNVAMAVGPEGGFTATETRMARDLGFLPVNLGPLVLRTETAALAMLVLVGHLTGRLHAPSTGRW